MPKCVGILPTENLYRYCRGWYLFAIYDDPILLSLGKEYTDIKLLDNGTGVRLKLPSIPSSMKIGQRSIINVALFTLKSPLNVAHKRGSLNFNLTGLAIGLHLLHSYELLTNRLALERGPQTSLAPD